MILRGQEDTWIKDSRGVWVKHGNPTNTPDEVSAQQTLITKAQQMYNKTKSSGQDLSNGPCLGSINDDWVVDIVHNPRTDVDNLNQNQCTDFLAGTAHHFIELDLNGNIIRIN